jgi:hypothetical protein
MILPRLGHMSAHSWSSITPKARVFFGVNALAAWLGLAVAFLLSLFGTYPNTGTDPTLFGFNPPGTDGAIGRVGDFFSYFTIWSNIVVGIVMTMLWLGSKRTSTKLFAVLRLDALIMITVTGLVYALVLAPSDHLEGWQYLSNSLEHYITPVLTIVVFIVFGPRKQLRYGFVLPALVLPMIWVALTLVRGTFINAYPYGFINVAKWGYGTVFINLVGIVVIGVLFGLVFVAIDRTRSKRQRAL